MQFDPNDLKDTIDKATKSFHKSVIGKDKKGADRGTEEHYSEKKDGSQEEKSIVPQENADESVKNISSKESESIKNKSRQRKSSAGGRRSRRGRRSKAQKQESSPGSAKTPVTNQNGASSAKERAAGSHEAASAAKERTAGSHEAASAAKAGTAGSHEAASSAKAAEPKESGVSVPKAVVSKESSHLPAEKAKSNVSGAVTSKKAASGKTTANKRRTRRAQKTEVNDVDSAVKKEAARLNTAKKHRARNSGKSQIVSESTNSAEKNCKDVTAKSSEILETAGKPMPAALQDTAVKISAVKPKFSEKPMPAASQDAAVKTSAEELKESVEPGLSAEKSAVKASAEKPKLSEKPVVPVLQETELKATGAAAWKRAAARKSSVRKSVSAGEGIGTPIEKQEPVTAEENLSQATGAAAWKRTAARRTSAKKAVSEEAGRSAQGRRGAQESQEETEQSGSQPTKSSAQSTSKPLKAKDFSENKGLAGEYAKAAGEEKSKTLRKTGEKLSELSAGAGQFFRNLWTRCADWWKGFFASLVKKVGYTIAATAVIGIVAVLFCSILFLSMAGSGNGKTAGNGAEGMAPEEGSEADYDGMAPADESGTSAWSQAIPGQTEETSGDTALSNAFQGLFTQTREAAAMLREQAEKSIREDYYEILESGKAGEFTPESGAQAKLWEEVRTERKEKLKKEPLLILVNKWHHLPEDYQVEPVDLSNGQQISIICYEKLNKMLEDCAAAGGTPIVCSGFRAHEKQEVLFEQQIQRWLYLGYGQEEAEALAATAVAIPGTSEHELGLAADIYSSENMDLDESQVNTRTQQWLMENCWKYGFILRYPKDKSEITGIIFEPWHYRYVGEQYAEKIHKSGLSLEEYLDEAEHPYSPTDPFASPEEETVETGEGF